ncbi:hypothetical protein DB347_09130 [Opitutaceae bacterium EW11]|nr:hypothetical protein DB347_09130 [Opitutaceae bacterium EW11]
MATLRRFLKAFHGSSIPTLCETDDGAVCVIKLHGAGNGPESMISEYVVNRIASAAGLPVPPPLIVDLPADYPWNFGTDEFFDIVRKSGGPNLGLAYLGDTKPLPCDAYASVSPALIAQVVTLDLIFSNVDRRCASGNLLQDDRGQAWIVDHGSCRFLHRESPSSQLTPGHAFTGSEHLRNPQLLPPVSPRFLEAIVGDLPDPWLRGAAITREHVARRIAACCGRPD